MVSYQLTVNSEQCVQLGENREIASSVNLSLARMLDCENARFLIFRVLVSVVYRFSELTSISASSGASSLRLAIQLRISSSSTMMCIGPTASFSRCSMPFVTLQQQVRQAPAPQDIGIGAPASWIWVERASSLFPWNSATIAP